MLNIAATPRKCMFLEVGMFLESNAVQRWSFTLISKVQFEFELARMPEEKNAKLRAPSHRHFNVDLDSVRRTFTRNNWENDDGSMDVLGCSIYAQEWCEVLVSMAPRSALRSVAYLACNVGHWVMKRALRDRQAHCCMLRVLEGPQSRRALPETYYCRAPTLSTSGLSLAIDGDWRLANPHTRSTCNHTQRRPAQRDWREAIPSDRSRPRWQSKQTFYRERWFKGTTEILERAYTCTLRRSVYRSSDGSLLIGQRRAHRLRDNVDYFRRRSYLHSGA